MIKTIVFHADVCTGCRECQKECLIARDAARIRVVRLSDTAGAADNCERFCALQCQQCLSAACIEICPASALERYPLGSLVTYDPVACTRCGLCVNACEFGGIYYDKLLDVMAKCDLCGGEPRCVSVCPTHALELANDTQETAQVKEQGFALLREASLLL